MVLQLFIFTVHFGASSLYFVFMCAVMWRVTGTIFLVPYSAPFSTPLSYHRPFCRWGGCGVLATLLLSVGFRPRSRVARELFALSFGVRSGAVAYIDCVSFRVFK